MIMDGNHQFLSITNDGRLKWLLPIKIKVCVATNFHISEICFDRKLGFKFNALKNYAKERDISINSLSFFSSTNCVFENASSIFVE